jgi:hypothetical protein
VWASEVAKKSFGHVPIAVYQGQQRRDAVSAGEEQLGRCTAEQSIYYQFYLSSFKLALAAIYLRRVRVVGRGLAAALAHV